MAPLVVIVQLMMMPVTLKAAKVTKTSDTTLILSGSFDHLKWNPNYTPNKYRGRCLVQKQLLCMVYLDMIFFLIFFNFLWQFHSIDQVYFDFDTFWGLYKLLYRA